MFMALFIIAPVLKQSVNRKNGKRHPHDGLLLQHGWLSNSVLRESLALESMLPEAMDTRLQMRLPDGEKLRTDTFVQWGKALTRKRHEGAFWCGGKVLHLDKSVRKEGSVCHSVVSDPQRPRALQPARLLCPWDFPRQECWSGLPFPSPRELPDPGTEPGSPTSQADSLPFESPGKPWQSMYLLKSIKRCIQDQGVSFCAILLKNKKNTNTWTLGYWYSYWRAKHELYWCLLQFTSCIKKSNG